MMKLTGVEQFNRKIDAELKKFEDECVMEVQKATRVLLEALFLRTPVWSGETVRNYAAAVGRYPGGGSKGHIGPKPPPDHTNRLPIGVEHNRPANQAAARADVEGAIQGMKKLRDVFMTNTVGGGKWDLIEYGSAPTPATARNPGGVSLLAMQTARSKLEHFK